jgi:predicted nuclease of restriction endonuclease-like (RecB) superfamily
MPGPQADLARETLKNPYNFDFLTLGKEAGERDPEDAFRRGDKSQHEF